MEEDGLTAVEDQAVLEEVRLLASLIPDAPGKHFVRLLEVTLPSTHQKGEYASKYTHFALLLIYSGGRALLLERRRYDVVVSVVEDSVSSQPYIEGSPVPLYHENRQYLQVGKLPRIPDEYIHSNVKHFVSEQRSFGFRSLTKNCKHLCFDLWKSISPPEAEETNILYRMLGLHEQTACERFCKTHEEVFRRNFFQDGLTAVEDQAVLEED